MEIQEAAIHLDGNEYGAEGSRELFAEMKASRLVAVFGYSDDLMEMRGAVNDEFGLGPVYVDSSGVIENDCGNEGCPYFAKLIATARASGRYLTAKATPSPTTRRSLTRLSRSRKAATAIVAALSFRSTA